MKLTPQQKSLIKANEDADIRSLALKLRKDAFTAEETDFILMQIAGRQTAKQKIPSWYINDEIIYPIHLSLEQASSEITAKYKASLISEKMNTLVDLTGGIGVDFSFLSSQFQDAVYVEQDATLCETAKYNFAQLKLTNVTVRNDRAENYLSKLDSVDLIYLDPSRRSNSGQKVVRIEDCSPNLNLLKNELISKSQAVWVKYSPMLDISRALDQLEYVSEVHIVSVNNECKELLFLLNNAEETVRLVAVNLRADNKHQQLSFTFKEEAEAKPSYTEKIFKYLYEPNASILKAGAFKTVAHRFNMDKLHINSHLYTSDQLIPDFPGRTFEVSDYFVPNKQNIKNFITGTKKANISVRNFPISVAEIRHKTGLKEGGEIYLFATTLADDKHVWISCKKS